MWHANGTQRTNGFQATPTAGHAPKSLKTLAEAFTTRELEVLRLLADGVSTKTIATRMSVSLCTVRNHVQHLLAKSGAHTRAELVSLGFQTGLL